jgi:capsular exopolysaccharide synthesis family protein
MDKNDELMSLLLQKESSPYNIKDFLLKILYYWKWFVLAGILSLVLAYFINKFTPATYKAQSTLMVKEQVSKLSMSDLFGGGALQSDVKIDNYISQITSFTLNHKVLENLGWYISWYKTNPLGDYDMFGQEPCAVEYDKKAFNLKSVPVFIQLIDSTHYSIEVDTQTSILGIPTHVAFNQTVQFGDKFENQYFSFILHKRNTALHGSFYFVFNNLDYLCLNTIGRLHVSTPNKNTNLINLSISGQNPAKQIDYLNELAAVYIHYGLKEKNKISDNTIQFIDHLLKDIVDTLKSTSNEFTQFRSSNKVFNLGQEASIVVEKLNELDSKRSMAKMQLEYYNNLKDYIANDNEVKNMVIPSVIGITDPVLNSLIIRLTELYSKKETLSYTVQDKNPSVQTVTKELEYIKKSLAENLKNLIFNTTNELNTIEKEIQEVNKQLSAYPKTEQDLINIKRMVDLNNELYTFLLQKRAEAQITKASNVPDVDLLDPARQLTIVRIGPNKRLNLMLSLVLGLAIPLLIILIKDFFDETIHSRDQLEKLTEIPVIADVMHNTYDQTVPVVEHPRSVLAESFRELRTSLEYLSFDHKNKVVGIHSMVPQEGKTFVSSNLAAIVAMNNLKVVLIGADMRKPTLHETFDLQKEAGLSTYLIGHHKLDEIIKPSGIKNLDIITSGVVPPNPVELLGSAEFGKLISELKRSYDMVLIDNSPLTLVTDGAITCRYTDSNLFVVRQNYSSRKLIGILKQLTEKNKMKKAGIVLNDINPDKAGSYAYRYGSSYYSKAYYGQASGYFDEHVH